MERKNVLIVGAALGLSALLFVYMPLFSQTGKKNHELNGLLGRLRVSESELALLSGDAGGRRIVSEDEASSLVDRIVQEGKNCLLGFKSIAQKEIRIAEEGYIVLPLHLEIEGRFEQLGVFLGRLDSLKEGLAGVEGFQILSDDNQGAKVSAFLTLNLYLQKGVNGR